MGPYWSYIPFVNTGSQKLVYIKPGRSPKFVGAKKRIACIFLPGKMGGRREVFRDIVTKVITLMSKKKYF